MASLIVCDRELSSTHADKTRAGTKKLMFRYASSHLSPVKPAGHEHLPQSVLGMPPFSHVNEHVAHVGPAQLSLHAHSPQVATLFAV